MKIGRIWYENTFRWVEVLSDQKIRLMNGGLFDSLSASRTLLSPQPLLAPLIPKDILGIGLNYSEHVKEGGGEIPSNPVVFMKASNSLNHPDHNIELNSLTRQVDFEAELAVIIGKPAKKIPEENALEYVFGYTCANDISARDWQKDLTLGGGQFVRGKSFDGFCPLGPWIVTKEEIPDPQNLQIQCILNNKLMQTSNTAKMIFSVSGLIHRLSQTMTLQPGTVILTGTPSGVGFARKPPVFLKHGDRLTVTISGIGSLTNKIMNPVIQED